MHIATLARITYRIIAYHDAAWGYHVHTALNQTWIRLISYMYHTCISIPLEVVGLGLGVWCAWRERRISDAHGVRIMCVSDHISIVRR